MLSVFHIKIITSCFLYVNECFLKQFWNFILNMNNNFISFIKYTMCISDTSNVFRILTMYFIHEYSVYFLLHLSYIKHFCTFYYSAFSLYIFAIHRGLENLFFYVFMSYTLYFFPAFQQYYLIFYFIKIYGTDFSIFS